MADRELEPLLGTGHFRVRIGRRELGFCQVGPLSSETDLTAEYPHHTFETVVLRRALTRSKELYEWRRRVVEGFEDRRHVTISQLDAPAGRIVNTWRLVAAWPCRWSGPTFDSVQGGLAYEELELAFDDLVWLDEGAAPPVRPRPKRTQGD